MNTPLSISVIIATYRRAEFLEKCLAALARQERLPEEIVIVVRPDDHETAAALSALPPEQMARVRGVAVNEPGIVAAENRGLAAARGDIVALIDDDGMAREDWLRRLEEHYAVERVAAVGGPVVPFIAGRPQLVPMRGRCLQRTWFGAHIGNSEAIPPAVRRVHFLRGCNMSFRRALVPAFDARLLPYWRRFEDDALLPLHRRGFEILYDPEIQVYHHTAPIQEGASRHLDATAVHGSHHNNTYVTLKHSSALQKVVFLIFTFVLGDRHNPGILGYLVKAILKRCPGRVARELPPALRGKAAGLASWRRWRAERDTPPPPR